MSFEQERKERIHRIANSKKILEESKRFFDESIRLQYSYNFEWLGRPIIQYPQDIVAFQEVVFETKPDLIIETGIAHGGSLILSASMLALLDLMESTSKGELINPNKPKRKVLGVDIDIRDHNRKAIENHPLSNRIEMIQGSSIEKDTIEKVKKIASNYKRIMVSLDSNHTHSHVLAELEAFAPLVSIGCYCVVFDTVVDDLPSELIIDRPWGKGNNPKTAVSQFLKTNPEFEINTEIQNKLLVTVAPDGWLKRNN